MFVSLFAASLAFGICSCSSSNEGKIVGHWEAVSGPMVDKFKATLPKADDPKARVSAMVQFKAEGDFAMGWRVTNLYVPFMSGKYKLGPGSVVELTELKINQNAGELASQPNLTVKVAIDGDAMTFTDSSGDTKFQRMSVPPAKAAAPTTAK
jgi:hypothetical protein